jgi:bifunctional polynucleotide phosphatase/kinase
MRRFFIIKIGPPASGKTTFVTNYILTEGYTHINQDTLKSKAKCLSALTKALQSGQSAVIDNTNPDAKTRSEFIQVAQSCGVAVRAFVMVASTMWMNQVGADDEMRMKELFKALCIHNSKVRALTPNSNRDMIPRVAFDSFFSRFQEPSAESEGLLEVKKIYFKVDFASQEEEAAWRKFY